MGKGKLEIKQNSNSTGGALNRLLVLPAGVDGILFKYLAHGLQEIVAL